MAEMVNINEWISNKRNDISNNRFYCNFDNLPKEKQLIVHNDAINLFGIFLSEIIDRAVSLSIDVCRGCIEYTARCGKYPCKLVTNETGNPPHYKCIRCCEYLNPDNNCPCDDVLRK